MRKMLIRLIVAATLVLGAAVPVLADGGGGDPPLCYPGEPRCPNN